MARQFVMLDRDGTIMVERYYLSDPAAVELLPGVGEGLRALQELGLGVIVVTNQSGVGRGYFDHERVDVIHRRLCDLLAVEGVTLDGIYVCPHVPEDNCLCRKPLPGLVERAAADLGFNPGVGFMIGDKVCDTDLGQRVGATTFLVRTGYGGELEAAGTVVCDYIVDDVAEAARVIGGLLHR